MLYFKSLIELLTARMQTPTSATIAAHIPTRLNAARRRTRILTPRERTIFAFPGTMSLFFNITDGDKAYKAGMFGGSGHNTLVKAYLEKYNISRDVRNTFRESLLRVREEEVEVHVGNHVGNNDTEGKIKLLPTCEKNPFLDSSDWKRFIDSRIAKIDEIIKNDE